MAIKHSPGFIPTLKPFALALVAVALFVPLFAIHRISAFDFWWWMSANIFLLITLSFAADRSYLTSIISDLRSRLAPKILFGVLSALLLYAFFYSGNFLLRKLFPFTDESISCVYSFKGNASTLRMGLLIAFLIGPGEEIFWRGYLQRHWQNWLGAVPGWLLSMALYSAVHLSSRNIMLVLAAGVCGLFWGALYLRYRSVVMVAISHTLWDLLVFLALPLSN